MSLRQPERGYRYSVDALLLADFAASRRARACLDLGTGSGVIAIRLLERGSVARALGIERDPELAACARHNALALGLGDRLEILEDDLRRARSRLGAGSFDLVVANPPFFSAGTGRPSPRPGRAAARHEGETTLADFAATARHALARAGRFCLILPAPRLFELASTLRPAGLEPKRLRLVHPAAGQPAKLVLCEARAAKPGGLVVEPPLVLG